MPTLQSLSLLRRQLPPGAPEKCLHFLGWTQVTKVGPAGRRQESLERSSKKDFMQKQKRGFASLQEVKLKSSEQRSENRTSPRVGGRAREILRFAQDDIRGSDSGIASLQKAKFKVFRTAF